MKAKKILLLGAPAVGKTAMARRLNYDTFSADYRPTIGVQLHTLEMQITEPSGAVVLWDTDGNFGEKVFDSAYAKGASGALIVADCSRPDTIDHLLRLMRCFELKHPGLPCVALFNKTDRIHPDALTLEVIKKQCKQPVLCSALTGQQVQSALQFLAPASIPTAEQRDAA